MREIKFRAYDKENKKMVYSDEVFPRSCYKLEFDCFNDYEFRLMKMIGRYNVIDDQGYETYQEVFKAVDAGIMQYTGIKDANGKDIYEGDIVKRQDERIGVIKYGRYDTTDINGINNIGFYIDWKDNPFTRIDLGFWIKQVEVIGNIYENPELLGE